MFILLGKATQIQSEYMKHHKCQIYSIQPVIRLQNSRNIEHGFRDSNVAKQL